MSSGFNTRGTVYINARAYIDEVVPGGLAGLVETLPEQEAEFLQGLFLGGSMYDLMPLMAITEHAAKLTGQSFNEYVIACAGWLAERDARGAYKVLLKLVSPEAVAQRLPKASLRYFDFGEPSASMPQQGVCLAEQRGIPGPLQEWFTACVYGFVPVVMRIAGAGSVTVRRLDLCPDGSAHGCTTATLKFEFRWT